MIVCLNTKKVVNTILSTCWLYFENKSYLSPHFQILKLLGAWLRSMPSVLNGNLYHIVKFYLVLNYLSASITKLNHTIKMKLVLSYLQARSTYIVHYRHFTNIKICLIPCSSFDCPGWIGTHSSRDLAGGMVCASPGVC